MNATLDGYETLDAIRDEVRHRFPTGLSFRLGPSRIWFHHARTLEIIPWCAHAAAVDVDVDEAELRIHFGGGAYDWGHMERHPVGEGAIDWAVSRIVEVGSHGMEMWSDSRRPLFGGREVTTIAGEETIGVSTKHRARLTKTAQTETWDTQTVGLVDDPLPRSQNAGSIFLVYPETPQPLLDIALLVRAEFAEAVSVVSRRDGFHADLSIEIVPHNSDATRMILRTSESGLEASTGEAQYINMEFSPIPAESAAQWVLDVGREGLLETDVRRGIVSWDVNGPASTEAVARANNDRHVTMLRVWQPWV